MKFISEEISVTSLLMSFSDKGKSSANWVLWAELIFSLLFIEVSVEETYLNMEHLLNYNSWKCDSLAGGLFSSVSTFWTETTELNDSY